MKFMPVVLPASAIVSLIFLCLAVSPSFAMNASEKAQLEKLDPATRLEQRCDVEAMERITREQKFSVKLSFVCKTDEEHINIVSFRYDIGDEVPQNQWDKHYLVP